MTNTTNTCYMANFRTNENASFFFGESATYSSTASLVTLMPKGYIVSHKIVSGVIYKATTTNGRTKLQIVANITIGTFMDEFGDYYIKITRL